MPITELPQLENDIQSMLDSLELAVGTRDVLAGQHIFARLSGLPVGSVIQSMLEVKLGPEPEGKALTLTTPFELQILVNDLRAKAILFKESDTDGTQFQNSKPQLPVVNLTALPTVGNTNLLDLSKVPDTAVQGVAGLKGSIEGTLKPVTGQLVSTLTGTLNLLKSVPISVSIKWKLLTGQEADSPPLNEADFRFDGDITAPTINVLLRPETYDWLDGSSPVQPVTRWLHCTVTVTTDALKQPVRLPGSGEESEVLEKKPMTKDLIPVPLTVTSLGIPRIAAFFADVNFSGPCLVLVPQNSPIKDVAKLTRILEPVQNAVAALTSFANFASLATGLSKLLFGFAATAHSKVLVMDGIPKLNDVVLIEKDLIHDNMECEDEFSSMILIGNRGAKVECYALENYKSEGIHWKGGHRQGWYDVWTTGLAVLVKNLHASVPQAEGEGALKVRLFARTLDQIHPFGDFLSSVRFATQSLHSPSGPDVPPADNTTEDDDKDDIPKTNNPHKQKTVFDRHDLDE